MSASMIDRGEIIWLGVAAGVTGGMIGGIFLAFGLVLVGEGVHIGIIPICISAPVSGLIGWLLARRLARQLG